MSSDEFWTVFMAVGGFITVGLILVFLPSSHKREKKHGKRNAWNPYEY